MSASFSMSLLCDHYTVASPVCTQPASPGVVNHTLVRIQYGSSFSPNELKIVH